MRSLDSTRRYRKTKKGVLTNMYDHMRRRHKVDFSLKEFHNKFLDDKVFNELYAKWVSSGFGKQFKPSLDRTDCKKHYSWDNVKMMTWSENRRKQSLIDGKRGRKPAVLQIEGGKVVKRFESQLQVIQELGLHQGNLSLVLNGKRNYIKGYKFIYENPELIPNGI